MKKILFLLAVLICTSFSTLKAQKSFEPSIKFKGEIGLDDYKNKLFGLEFTAGYRFNDYIRAGVGTGISYCDLTLEGYFGIFRGSEAYIPLFANVKANFVKIGISPYMSFDLGHSFLVPFSDAAKKTDLGIFANPAFGVDFPLSSGSIFFEVGYKYQAMESEYITENMNYSQLTIAVGYNF